MATSVLEAMDASGDTKITWDSANADEVAAARETFIELRRKNFHAFAVKKNGDAGMRITAFDPDAERIIMVPQLAGG